MTEDPRAIAAALPPGTRHALPHLSREWQFPSHAGFNAFGAFTAATRRLAEQKEFGGRFGYRITPLGEQVRAILQEGHVE
jgi:hypothetical protein